MLLWYGEGGVKVKLLMIWPSHCWLCQVKSHSKSKVDAEKFEQEFLLVIVTMDEVDLIINFALYYAHWTMD